MDSPHINIVYQFQQHVEIMSRESERAKPVNEAYDRLGLILLSAGIEQGRWCRELAEYELSAAKLEAVRRAERVDRADLQEASLSLAEGRQVPFGLDLPAAVDSDKLNRDVALPDDERIPLRHDLLYLPTILPVVPEMRAEVGQEWKGQIAVLGGAGRFRIDYTATMLRRIGDDPEIGVTILPQPAAQTIGEVTLTLTPEGACKIHVVRDDGAPRRAEGELRIRIRAKLTREGRPVDVEVLDCRQKFTLTRVPASFTDDEVLLAGWRIPGDTKPESP